MGKSFGGAIASKVLENTCAVGCIAIGYPFFNPLTKWNRINHLPGIQKKLIIIQGSEDSQGGRDEIEEASLSSSTEIKWIQNADHGFKTNSSPEQDEIKYNELLQACSDACNTIISNCDHRQCAIGFKSGINE
jgi:predicted alpha/beta-hydrolase family hydrolase